jgi:hypothetical protein
LSDIVMTTACLSNRRITPKQSVATLMSNIVASLNYER